MISFHQLIGDGGKDGAREKFERLVAQLVSLQYPTVRKVEANPGDWGLDVIVGEIDGVLSVWQAKFFIDGVAKSQQAQIRESFDQAVASGMKRGFSIDVWTLCIPVDLDAKSLSWWTTWSKKKTRETGVRLELWDRTALEMALITPDAEHIRAAAFPDFNPQQSPRPSRAAVLELPEDITYDDMLFVRQLEAANIREHSSAKQQFFNAEVLSREVADKRVPEHVQALEGERADLLSIWEDRYNDACREPDAGDGLLPRLHPDVMSAIERRHDSGRVEALLMHLVHRKGAMHQVVENGRAGWIRDFRSVIADDHA